MDGGRGACPAPPLFLPWRVCRSFAHWRGGNLYSFFFFGPPSLPGRPVCDAVLLFWRRPSPYGIDSALEGVFEKQALILSLSLKGTLCGKHRGPRVPSSAFRGLREATYFPEDPYVIFYYYLPQKDS